MAFFGGRPSYRRSLQPSGENVKHIKTTLYVSAGRKHGSCNWLYRLIAFFNDLFSEARFLVRIKLLLIYFFFTRDSRYRDRKKSSGQTHLLNIWTKRAMAITSGQPLVGLLNFFKKSTSGKVRKTRSQCRGAALVSIRIRIQHFLSMRIRIRGFDDKRIIIFIYFFWSKLAIFLYLGLY